MYNSQRNETRIPRSDDNRVSKELITLDCGITYEGHWKDNVKDGYGIMKWPDGSVYEGEWNNDKFSGVGRLRYGNGDSYEGQWSND